METINSRYQLISPIGSGGMGAVYRAADRLNGQTVALKRLKVAPEDLIFNSKIDLSELGSDYGDVLRLALTQEFQMLASLRHPHIISVLDYGFDAARLPYFTMTLVEKAVDILDAADGGDLRVKIDLLLQILQALAYMHRRGIVHRDLKPGNVLVTGDGQARVLDFGLAVEEQRVGEIAGTPGYMPPEVLRGMGATPAADLYAFGVIVYEMFVGRLPFEGSSWLALSQRILKDEPPLDPLPDALRPFVGRLLEKKPQHRYGSAEETITALCEAVGLPAPVESIEVRESFLQAAKFVGRSWELGLLTDALSEAVRGRGSAWLIGGESGVGKSRLLDELRVRALVEGALTVRGQLIAEGGAYLHGWREPARRLVLEGDLSDDDASVLKTLVPDIEGLLGRPIPDAPSLGEGGALVRIVETLVRLCTRERGAPLVILMEDIHWADESIAPIGELADLVRRQHVSLMLVATYRDDERPDIPDMLPNLQPIKLGRLNSGAIEQISAVMIGADATTPELVALLEKETEGNLFFLVETLRALAETAGSLNEIGRSSLPAKVFAGGVQAIVRRRLDRAPEHARPWLKLAAVAGRQIDLTLLERLGLVKADNWLIGCANAAILDAADGRWRFSHDKLREALLSDLAPDERVMLHRQVAETLETLNPTSAQKRDHAFALTEHWRVVGDTLKEAEYLNFIIEIYTRLGKYHDIIERAEDMIARLPAEGAAAKSKLLLHIANSYEALGNFDKAEQYVLESLPLQLDLDDFNSVGKAYNTLGILAAQRGDLTVALERFLQAEAYYRHSAVTVHGLSGTLSNIGIVYQWRRDFPNAHRYYDESLALARQFGDKESLLNPLNNVAFIAVLEGDVWTATTHYEEATALARELGALRPLSYMLQGVGRLALVQGHVGAARSYIDEALALARQIEHVPGVVLSLELLAECAIDEGRLDEALMIVEDGLKEAERINYVVGISDLKMLLGYIHIDMGMTAQAQTELRAALRSFIHEEAAENALLAMIGFGLIYLREGLTNSAALIAAMISSHPLGNTIMVQRRFGQLREELAANKVNMKKIQAPSFETIVKMLSR